MIDQELQAALDEHLAKLAAIGTADQLAVHFEGQGMRALCGNAQECAIAQSIVKALGHMTHGEVIWVTPERVTFATGSSNVYVARANFSYEIQFFIERFDEHAYPAISAY